MIKEKINQKASAEADNREEHLIGIIPDAYRKKAFGRKDNFNITVTTNRMIFILLAGGGDKTSDLSDENLTAKTREEILSGNKKNFVFDRGEIKSVTFTPAHRYVDCCQKVIEMDGELEITANDTRHVFKVPAQRTTIAKNILKKSWLVPLLDIIKPK